MPGEGVGLIVEKRRNPAIDFLKLIACIMVVILHGVGVGDGMQEIIYLIGTYGIPLFFMVNGYLLAKKTIDISYAGRQALRYIIFILIWSLIIGLPYAIKDGDMGIVINTFCGAILGEGKLYHLWFLTALVFIYFVVALIETVSQRIEVYPEESIGGYKLLLYCLIGLSLSFVLNLILKKYLNVEIRDVIPAPIRIITNGSYFVIGKALRHLLEDSHIKMFKKWNVVAIILIPALHTTLCITSYFLDIKWASSFYTYLPVVMNCIIIFILFMQQDHLTFISKANPMLDKTIGIWVLHPFVLKLMIKVYTILLTEQPNLIVKCVMMVTCILLCSCIVAIANRNKYLRKCFTI